LRGRPYPFLLVQTRSHGLYIGARGVDGPDSTGVSTDTRLTPMLFDVLCFLTPHPDAAQVTRCLDILARYSLWACSISGLLEDSIETKVFSGGVHSTPACTTHVHTILGLATTSKPSNHSPARHLAVAQAHVAAALRALGCDRPKSSREGEQAEPRLPRALLFGEVESAGGGQESRSQLALPASPI
jgi:hypothetical protein